MRSAWGNKEDKEEGWGGGGGEHGLRRFEPWDENERGGVYLVSACSVGDLVTYNI